MARPTKPLDDLAAGPVRVQIILDRTTLETLDALCQAEPDIESRSAAIRKLARDWRRKRRAKA